MQKLNDGKISILVNPNIVTIEILDSDSSTTFVKVELTPEQFATALSRQMNVECNISVMGLDRIGKKMIHKVHEFEIPNNIPYNKRKEELSEIIKETLPEGWVSDNYFASQNTFFEKDGKKYARTTIRQWI